MPLLPPPHVRQGRGARQPIVMEKRAKFKHAQYTMHYFGLGKRAPSPTTKRKGRALCHPSKARRRPAPTTHVETIKSVRAGQSRVTLRPQRRRQLGSVVRKHLPHCGLVHERHGARAVGVRCKVPRGHLPWGGGPCDGDGGEGAQG